MSRREEDRYPRVRIDALHDGIFAVAMTLLVLDIRLPEDFHPADAAELSRGLIGLWPKLWPYMLSFYVLGVRWLSSVRLRGRGEKLEVSYIRWWLLYLLLITCVPFTTIVVGRYGSLAPACWLYAGNTALIALVSWRMLALTPELEDEVPRYRRNVSLAFLLISALLCIAWTFVDASQALFALLVNTLAPLWVHVHERFFARASSSASGL